MNRTSLQPAKRQEDQEIEPNGVHRYPLPIPNSLYAELRDEAQYEQLTLLDAIKRCLKIGLKVKKIQREPETELIVRRPGKPDEILTFL